MIYRLPDRPHIVDEHDTRAESRMSTEFKGLQTRSNSKYNRLNKYLLSSLPTITNKAIYDKKKRKSL